MRRTRNSEKTPEPAPEYERLYKALGYRFRDKALIVLALTHCSVNGQTDENNQRMEYLGDAVLEFIVSEELYKKCTLDEGHLTRIRASIVCEASLFEAAKKADAGRYILLGKGEESTGGRDKPSILADSVEAMIGAAYLDGGIMASRRVIRKLLGASIRQALNEGGGQDYKTELQQFSQRSSSRSPEYRLVSATGPAHERVFTVNAAVNGKELGTGQGRTVKEAEQNAAKQALASLKKAKPKRRH